MSDQRRHPRVPVRQRVWCEGTDVTLYVQALNVSHGGLFVRTASPAAAGRHFRVSFSDLEDGEVVAEVEVVWSQRNNGSGQPGMGVRILAFERGAENFSRFVDRQLSTGAAGGPENGSN